MVAIAFWFGFLSGAYWWQARAREDIKQAYQRQVSLFRIYAPDEWFNEVGRECRKPADPAEMEPRAAPAEK